MKHDLLAYRAELQRKLDAVDAILSDMTGGSVRSTAPTRSPNGRRKVGKRTMSAAGRARIAAAARLRWKKIKAAGKNRL